MILVLAQMKDVHSSCHFGRNSNEMKRQFDFISGEGGASGLAVSALVFLGTFRHSRLQPISAVMAAITSFHCIYIAMK